MLGFFILAGSTVYADDLDLPATGDLWDNWNTREEGREVKPVTDEEFDKAIDQVDLNENTSSKNEIFLKGKNLARAMKLN